MLDKPKKSNKSRFSVDIGKKHINKLCSDILIFPPAIFNYKRCKIAFALVEKKSYPGTVVQTVKINTFCDINTFPMM